MPARTYIPTLVFLVRQLCVYTTRWDPIIRRNLGGEALAAFSVMSNACQAFLAATSVIDLVNE